jgi:stage V sporulation protein R
MAMQALVIAHAAYGHNSFFKGNYLFRMWTDASSIIDYLVYAKNYVAQCEERYGVDTVEEFSTPATRCRTMAWTATAGRPRSRWPRSWRCARTARPMPSSRSTTCGARCRARPRPPKRPRGPALPGRPGGEPALLHREERAAAGALAARDRAHRAQDGAVLLPAAPDPGDERGLGHLLAPQAAQHHVRRRLPHRRRDDRVAQVAHQRHLPAPVGDRGYNGLNPYALGFAMYTDIQRICEHPPTRTAPGSPTSPAALAAHAGPRHAQLQGRELHRPVPQPQADARLPPVRHQRRRAPAHAGGQRHPRRGRLPPGARGSRASTTWARASPTSRSGTSTCAATAA